MIEVKPFWTALISQTGTELVDISRKTKLLPGVIVTNNPKKLKEENKIYFSDQGVKIVQVPSKPGEQYYITDIMNSKLITLHGYLRIIPPEFFNRYTGKIYNGHPALITLYPELKGFNMQEAVAGKFEKYPFCGSVIHEVIPELDAGQVVVEARVKNVADTVDEAYMLMRATSLQTWEYFFKNFWKFE